ncbi:MAG TPA: sugar transferase [Salinimicrobium sp.]|nr:sugar transferase [Salinimicrobium sp.]
MTEFQHHQKRIIDLVLAVIGLVLLWWLILLAAFLAFLKTGTNGFFTQTRIGKNGKPFSIFKIRTIKMGANPRNPPQSALSAFLRNKKLDELPQLYNVLIGNMSFVGPRPDVPGFADKLQGKDRKLLQLRPGITGPATLQFKNEEALLAAQANPEHYNQTVIWPEKVRINLEYLHHWSLRKDISYIFQTIFG